MNITKYEHTLLKTKAFKYLDSKELDVIKGYCNIIIFRKSELLFKQGKKNSGMYIILKGSAMVVAKILGKNILNIATLEEGDFFGQVSLITKVPCAATVIANTEVHCLELTADYFDTLAIFYPEIRYSITQAIIENVCESLGSLYKNIIDTMNRSEMSDKPFPEKIMTTKRNTKSEFVTFEEANLNRTDLAKSTLFKSYTEEELDLLITNSELIKVSKDYTLITTGEEQSAYYFIIRGAIQLSIIHQKKKAKLAVLSPISMFCSSSNIIKKTNMIHYIVCERSIILKIPINKLKIIEHSNKSLWHKLSNSICESFVTLELAANKLIIRLNSELYNR